MFSAANRPANFPAGGPHLSDAAAASSVCLRLCLCVWVRVVESD